MERAQQIILWVASAVVALQIGVIHLKGSAVCPSEGCKLVEDLTTISPMALNVIALVYLIILIWLANRQASLQLHAMLLAGLAAETVLFCYQLFVAQAFCAYCLFVFAVILILNLLNGRKQLWCSTAIVAAIVVGFSFLRFNPVTAATSAWVLDDGVYGTRTCAEPSKQIYLIFSENCPHCIQVIDALAGCNSCELHLNPIDRIADLEFDGLTRNADYSPDVNRSILSVFGIDAIPVLLVNHQDGFQFIKGATRIIDYIRHACFKQEPTLYFDRSQFSDQDHITAFSQDEGECSVAIDCSDLEPASTP